MARVIDLHAHVVLEGAAGTAGDYGPEIGEEDGVPFFRVGTYVRKPMSYRGTVFIDVEKRLQAMDRTGIDQQLLSPNPLTFLTGIEAAPAIDHAKATNDAMAELVARHPDRLLGSAALPLQDPDAACAELERATRDLGLLAGYVGTDYGFTLDDVRLDDFYRTLVYLDVPLMLHASVNDGANPPKDARLGRFGLDLTVGYTYEETLAVAAIVLGGVYDRHPDVDICISHGGGAIAFLAQRFDAMAAFTGGPDLSSGFEKMWFDSHMGAGPARDLVTSIVGTDRMVYGTNFGGWDTPAQTDDFDAGLTPNAERLLRLAPSEGPH
ncbi:MAG: amidohydrolase family protein [Actinomycetota bacterium]|jgi:aminocarboxymuconate-semialdehyde decarboxylase|nr:amidohydrolase family protein [Actinomycetota bacterium]